MTGRVYAWLGGHLQLEGPVRSGVEAALLAAATPAPGRGLCLELGAGAGAAALSLALREGMARVNGLELDPGLVAVARRNARRNRLADRVTFDAADITSPASWSGHVDRYDSVMANPPFFRAGAGTPSPCSRRRRARSGAATLLGQWIGCAARVLRGGGVFTLVIRAERLGEVVNCLAPRFGDVTLFPLWPRAGRAAKLLLVQGRRGSRGAMRVAPGLVLHDGRGYTGRAASLLDGPVALSLLD